MKPEIVGATGIPTRIMKHDDNVICRHMDVWVDCYVMQRGLTPRVNTAFDALCTIPYGGFETGKGIFGESRRSLCGASNNDINMDGWRRESISCHVHPGDPNNLEEKKEVLVSIINMTNEI